MSVPSVTSRRTSSDARARGRTITPVYPAGAPAGAPGGSSELLERRPRQEEALLADGGEADHDLGLVALAVEAEHHALPEAGVDDVVAHLDAELLGAVAGRTGAGAALAGGSPPGPQGGLDHAIAVGAAAPAPGPVASAAVAAARVVAAGAVGAPAPAGPALLDGLHEVLGDLVEEAAGRVVLGAAVEGAAPRVAEVEAVLGPGERHVGEAPLLLELVGVADGPQVREHAVFEADDEHRRELEALGGVDRHEHHLAVVPVDLVGVGHQAHLLEKRLDRLGVLRGADELGEVLEAALGFDRA